MRSLQPLLNVQHPLVRRSRSSLLVASASLAFLILTQALSSAGDVRLAWAPSPEADLAGYRVLHGTSPGVYDESLDVGTNTTATVSGLTQGVTYYFSIIASFQSGIESTLSDEVSSQPEPPPNLPPVAGPLDLVGTEDVDLPIVLPASDPEGQALSISILRAPQFGSLSGANETWTFTPAPDWNGTDSFDYAVSDGVNTTTGSVTVALVPVNDAPRCRPPSDVVILEDGSTDLVLGAVDVDGDPLTFDISQWPQHASITGTLPNVTVHPDANQCGSDEFRYSVSDGTETREVIVPFTIVPVNDAPSASDATISVIEGESVPIPLAGHDPEGDALQFDITTPPSRGTVSGTYPNLVYTAGTDAAGTDTFTFTASDGSLTSAPATVSILITPSNKPPVAISSSVALNEDSTVPVQLIGSDLEGEPLTYEVIRAPAHGTLQGTAPLLTYRPEPNFHGTDSLQFQVSDGLLTSTVATVTLDVASINDAPVALGASYTVVEGESVPISLQATDLEGDVIAFSLNIAPSRGMLSGTIPNLVYTAGLDSAGTDNFVFVVSDGTLFSEPATVHVVIIPRNHPPVAASTPVAVDEDASAPVVLSAADPEGQAVTFEIVQGPAHGILSGTAPNLTYQPEPNYNGSDSIQFRASDGLLVSAVATVPITVSPVNDAPTAAGASLSTYEDIPLAIVLPGADVDLETLTYAVTKAPSKGKLSGTAPNLLYTPNTNYNGNDSLQFTVSDGRLTSASATVSIKVIAVNDTPKANPRSISLAEDSSFALTLTGSDPERTALSYVIKTPPQFGRITGTPPNIRYTPNTNFSGADSFQFTVSDGNTVSPPANVTVTVTPVNDAPTALAASLTTTSGTPAALPLAGQDVEGSSLKFAISTSPLHGTVSGTSPNFVYTPAANYTGTDSLQFTASDGKLTSAAATLTITIVSNTPSGTASLASTSASPDKDAPKANVAGDETRVVAYGGSLTQPPPHAVTELASQANAAVADVATVLGQPPAHGVVDLRPDGSFTYLHLGDNALTDTFTCIASLPGGAQVEYPVVVHVFRVLGLRSTQLGTDLEVSVTQGAVYQVESADGQAGSALVWTVLSTFTGETDGIATITDTRPAETHRHYRVRCQSGTADLISPSFRRPETRAAE